MEPVGDEGKDLTKRGKDSASFWLLYLVCMVEGADLQLLPSTLRALEAEVGLSPTHLAALATCQALAQSASAPLWGSLVDSGWSEKSLLVGGSMGWGILTFLLAGTTEWYSMLVLRTLNGLALAILTPVSQTLVARSTVAAERGHYFGMCELALIMGQLTCAIFATTISNWTVLGFRGWRVAFGAVALASLALSVMLMVLMNNAGTKERKVVSFQAESDMFRRCCKIGTFRIIVLQGCLGSIPWSALGTFAILFFQYLGIKDLQAAVLFATCQIALGLGNLLGGHVADTLARCSRFHGRPLAAQISVLSGLPLIVWFIFIPRVASSFAQYAVVLCVFGLTCSWCKAGVNRPILTEVVPESSQARILSWLIALEGSVAACLGPSMTSAIAEHAFQYEPQRGRLDKIPESLRATNARALAMGIFWMCAVPWTACFLIFSLLHFTYKSDVRSAHGADAEMSALLPERSHTVESSSC
uniref:Major facilitator superfamily (MFS) profile domain-containing protein n=1 Tax=Pyrodinium bahamense TaxID=73915 RepID=A0A7S0FSY7_9DINO|mmetsp:Transcript_46646/g.129781  ORF Transcript_46646/g.129781 Transcript_46646/m.129781 type:complete len:473 (+) Transcript_46646:57-1475(+)